MTVSQAQDHHNEDEDVCSPLCACSCCASQVIVQSCIFAAIGVPFCKKEFLENPTLPLPEPTYSIWQPPKLS